MTTVTNKIIACIAGSDWIKDYSDYDLTFNNSDNEILERLAPVLEEQFNVSIKDDNGWLYKTRKATESQNVYIIPNSTAGII